MNQKDKFPLKLKMKKMNKDLLFLFLILTTILNCATTNKIKLLSAKELAIFREKNLKSKAQSFKNDRFSCTQSSNSRSV
jgi:hypothetical protein